MSSPPHGGLFLGAATLGLVVGCVSAASQTPVDPPPAPLSSASSVSLAPPSEPEQPGLASGPPPKLAITFKRLGQAPSISRDQLVRLLGKGSWSTAGEARRARLSVAHSGQGRVWLKLDDYAPRVYEAPGEVALADLAPELSKLRAGHHRILAFTGDPLDCASLVVQELDLSIGKTKAAPGSGSPVRVFSPHGTLNGKNAPATARLCFSSADLSLKLRVSGPEGRMLVQALEPGEYAIDGLTSGDYSFEWVAGNESPPHAAKSKGGTVISVNTDAPVVAASKPGP